MNRIATGLTFLAITLLSSTAFAGYYSISGKIRYWDERSQRSDNYGSKLTGTVGQNKYARYVEIRLYDEDGACNDFSPLCNESDDDLLSTTTTDVNGFYAFGSVGDLEDIYLMTYYQSYEFELRDEDGDLSASISDTVIDFGSGGNLTKDWNITCSNDVRNVTQGFCDDQSDVDYWFATNAPFASIHQSAADVDVLISNNNLFTPNGHSGKIKIYYPEDPGSECDGSQTRSFSCDGICIGLNVDDDNHHITHEIGHALHKRQLNHCTALSDCGGGHSWTSLENEKCATSEGFADFVGSATYWYPYASSAWYLNSTSWWLENFLGLGNSSAQSCVSKFSSPHNRQGNVVRYFWDIYDSTTVGDTWHGTYEDNVSLSFDTILATWDEFVAGTGNRQASESDSNGRNVQDFAAYEGSALGEIWVNCLDAQDNN